MTGREHLDELRSATAHDRRPRKEHAVVDHGDKTQLHVGHSAHIFVILRRIVLVPLRRTALIAAGCSRALQRVASPLRASVIARMHLPPYRLSTTKTCSTRIRMRLNILLRCLNRILTVCSCLARQAMPMPSVGPCCCSARLFSALLEIP